MSTRARADCTHFDLVALGLTEEIRGLNHSSIRFTERNKEKREYIGRSPWKSVRFTRKSVRFTRSKKAVAKLFGLPTTTVTTAYVRGAGIRASPFPSPLRRHPLAAAHAGRFSLSPRRAWRSCTRLNTLRRPPGRRGPRCSVLMGLSKS